MNNHRLFVSLQVQDIQESGRQSNEEGLALYPPSLTSSPAFALTLGQQQLGQQQLSGYTVAEP